MHLLLAKRIKAFLNQVYDEAVARTNTAATEDKDSAAVTAAAAVWQPSSTASRKSIPSHQSVAETVRSTLVAVEQLRVGSSGAVSSVPPATQVPLRVSNRRSTAAAATVTIDENITTAATSAEATILSTALHGTSAQLNTNGNNSNPSSNVYGNNHVIISNESSSGNNSSTAAAVESSPGISLEWLRGVTAEEANKYGRWSVAAVQLPYRATSCRMHSVEHRPPLPPAFPYTHAPLGAIFRISVAVKLTIFWSTLLPHTLPCFAL